MVFNQLGLRRVVGLQSAFQQIECLRIAQLPGVRTMNSKEKELRVTMTRVAIVALMILLGSRIAANRAVGQTPFNIVKTTAQEKLVPPHSWRTMMGHSARTQTGCFQASYPLAKWKKVACRADSGWPSAILGQSPFGTGRVFKPMTTAASLGSITWAEGSFPSVSGVTKETGIDSYGNSQGENVFSIQLNSNSDFRPPLCDQGGLPNCTGWVQFTFNTVSGAFIEYWLINYGLSCPAGWSPQGDTVPNCLLNQGYSQPPGSRPQVTVQDLPNMSMQASAQAGGNDSVTVFLGSKSIGSFSASDTILSLANSWHSADFNILGIGDYATARFNNGVTIVTSLSLDDGTAASPACDITGSTTGETNSLQAVVPCCPFGGGAPGVSWTQSNVPGAISQCACSYSSYCPFYENQPPNYTYQCPTPVDFYAASGKSNLSTPTGIVPLATNAMTNSGSTTDEADYIAACTPGTTNQCAIVSINVARSSYCLTHSGGGGGGGGGVESCKQCFDNGQKCKIVNGKPTCVGVVQ